MKTQAKYSFPFLYLLTLVTLFIGCQRKSYFNRDFQSSYGDQAVTSEFGPVFRISNLKLLLIGRNRWEVQNILGEPEGKSITSSNDQVWDYRRALRDEETNQIFEWSLITITFSTGQCTSITHSLQNAPNTINGDGVLR